MCPYVAKARIMSSKLHDRVTYVWQLQKKSALHLT